MRKIILGLAATAAIALLSTVSVVAATEAHADSRSFADATTTPGSMDIHRVRVINEKRLTIRIVVDDLRQRAGQGSVGVWVDTNPSRYGPEFHIGSGLWDSDWQIGRARDWKSAGSVLNCAIDQRLLFDQDTIVFTTGRGCLGSYGKVRVSVTTWGGGNTDHSPAHHVFHPWVARY